MTEAPLYQDKKLKIDYLPKSGEDHIVYIVDSGSGDEIGYVIQRGILIDLAKARRDGLEVIIDTFNSQLAFTLRNEKISMDHFHIAVLKAYMEEQKRFEIFKAEFKFSQA